MKSICKSLSFCLIFLMFFVACSGEKSSEEQADTQGSTTEQPEYEAYIKAQIDTVPKIFGEVLQGKDEGMNFYQIRDNETGKGNVLRISFFNEKDDDQNYEELYLQAHNMIITESALPMMIKPKKQEENPKNGILRAGYKIRKNGRFFRVYEPREDFSMVIEEFGKDYIKGSFSGTMLAKDNPLEPDIYISKGKFAMPIKVTDYTAKEPVM
ncbi:MAG: hypothetical protein JJT94_10230 [Bernardetiaceae bacterium]|nr:hypothetical protein [Bernardetiaceae bacterium]